MTNQTYPLIEFLKGSSSARVNCADRWMVVDGDDEETSFTVLQRPFGKKRTVTLYEGENLDVALKFLSGEWT